MLEFAPETRTQAQRARPRVVRPAATAGRTSVRQGAHSSAGTVSRLRSGATPRACADRTLIVSVICTGCSAQNSLYVPGVLQLGLVRRGPGPGAPRRSRAARRPRSRCAAAVPLNFHLSVEPAATDTFGRLKKLSPTPIWRAAAQVAPRAPRGAAISRALPVAVQADQRHREARRLRAPALAGASSRAGRPAARTSWVAGAASSGARNRIMMPITRVCISSPS